LSGILHHTIYLILNHISTGFEYFDYEAISTWGLSIRHLLDDSVDFFLYDGLAQADTFILCDQFQDVLSYTLDGRGSVSVGIFVYPLEVFDQCVFNVLVGFSFYPILIPNIQNFVMIYSRYSCYMKEVRRIIRRLLLLSLF